MCSKRLLFSAISVKITCQYSTKMIFAVLDVSLIMGLNIGETDKVFYTLITTMRQVWSSVYTVVERSDKFVVE